MSNSVVIRNATLVNEGKQFNADVLIRDGLFERIAPEITAPEGSVEVNADGLFLFPGVIDDQVHFREPGLTHKADIYTEAKAAVAGGTTSFMEMPNTVPNTLTQELLQNKYDIAARHSLANYSFYMGVSNDNLDEVLRTDGRTVCGIKIFMGSSTGNMLVDDGKVLETIFAQSPLLIATHCEDEATVLSNLDRFRQQYGDEIPVECHPQIRNAEACYISSSFAVSLAKKHNTRLHILHISTEKELSLFSDQPVKNKRITSEACIHHLWFCDEDYKEKGNFIKWNPAVKASTDRDALLQAVKNGIIDVVATDHAPHTREEKEQSYIKAPSGGPLVQHSLIAMLELHHQGKISIEKIIEKMCHAPAECFNIMNRGFIREGYAADCVLVNLNAPFTVNKNNIYYKCGWSPFEGTGFRSQVVQTYVNGHCVYNKGDFNEDRKGRRLLFRVD